ncbi:hypothetical protein BH10PSE4_BH10PSE4_35130 [soil metagenome]
MSARAPLLAAILLIVAGAACTSPESKAASTADPDRTALAKEQPMRIRITAKDQSFTAVLDNSETARDFVSLLPIEVTLDDYNQTEKVADLPRRLSTAGAPDGADPVAGDIAYYAPWGNLALYYRDFAYSRGLVRLGRLEGDAAALGDMARSRARIEIVTVD